MQTHFISNSKSYLHCGKQHQSCRASITRLNVFLAANFVFATLRHKPQSFAKDYHWVSSVAEWSSLEGFWLGLNLEKSTFARLAFALVMILNIRKPNGISCPGFSPRPSWQPAGSPYNVQKWNARNDIITSVLLPNFSPFKLGSHVINLKARRSCVQAFVYIIILL
jgi:hypothetical protein